MSRSGYSYDCENLNLWRGTVTRAIRGKRGQAFLRELAEAMDAMPVKRLITDDLIDQAGEVCAIGAVCKARGLNVVGIDIECAQSVGDLVDISMALAAEIEWINDEANSTSETPEQRWQRVRSWVDGQIAKAGKPYARLVPLVEPQSRKPGAFRGQISGDVLGPIGSDDANWG